MIELISICLEIGDIMPMTEIMDELLTEQEAELKNWVIEYYSKYGKVPLVSQVQKEFPHFIPISWDKEEIGKISVEAIVDDLKHGRLVQTWEAALQEAIIYVRENKKIPSEIINRIQHLTATSDGISAFSGFDRGRYFRKPGLGIGIRMIDRATGGISAGELMTIAGRLGTGKTTFSLFIAHHWWSLGKKILFVSNEMLDADIFARLDGIVGKFNPLRLRTDDSEEMRKVATSAGVLVSSEHELHGGEIYIPNRRVRTPTDVFALARHLMVDAIIIDGLYLMNPDSGHFTAKWERVAEISNQVKQNALNYNLPVVALTQYKRTGGRKDVYDPEDIAYSDAIGQDSDFIIGINPSSGIKGRFELQLIKNRFGAEIATICSIDYDKMECVEDSVSLSADDRFWSAKALPETIEKTKAPAPDDDGLFVTIPEKEKASLWTDD